MAKLSILAGSTSKTVKVFVQDNSVTTGAGLTGLVFNSGSLTAYYIREGDASMTQITLVTATLGTWTSGGFIVVDATHAPGLYELGLPNAALSSAKSVVVYLFGATNMAPVVLEIELTAVDNQNANNFGLGVLPATQVPGAANGLFIAGSNAATTANIAGNLTGNVSGSVGSVTGAVGSVTGNVGGNVVGSVASVTGAVGSVTGSVGGNVTGSVGSVTGNVGGNVVGNVNGNVVGSVASVTAAVTTTYGIKKNTAYNNFGFVMTDAATGAPKTGVAVTATRSLDGAAFGACANAVAEVGSGYYKVNLANTDLNGNTVTLQFTGAGSNTLFIELITQS